MKIHTTVIIDMMTGLVLDDDCYEYTGPIALCGGSGGGSERKIPKPSELETSIMNTFMGVFNSMGSGEEGDLAKLIADQWTQNIGTIDEAEGLYRELPGQVKDELYPIEEQRKADLGEVSDMNQGALDTLKMDLDTYKGELDPLKGKTDEYTADLMNRLDFIGNTPGTSVSLGGAPVTTMKPLNTMKTQADLATGRYDAGMKGIDTTSNLIDQQAGYSEGQFDKTMDVSKQDYDIANTVADSQTDAAKAYLSQVEQLPNRLIGITGARDSQGYDKLLKLFEALYGPRMGSSIAKEGGTGWMDVLAGGVEGAASAI